MSQVPKGSNRYLQIIERVFHSHYTTGTRELEFERDELIQAAGELGIPLPKNIGDLIYSFRYRIELPNSIRSLAPPGEVWTIRPAGHARYRFSASRPFNLSPNALIAETKIPDATPGLIAKYALTDEQALLAKVRYNRLIDIFTGVACYSLQNHLRTQVPDVGQVETDELYVGVDQRGAQYVFPVQAKGHSDRLSIVQIEQDVALCQRKFPMLICRPIGAQFITDDHIALFSFEANVNGPSLISERHYRLVPASDVLTEDLDTYRHRPRWEDRD